MLYLDTSVLVSALTNEAGTAGVQEWLGRRDVEELSISDWVITEFSSALSIKPRAGQLSADHRAAALAAFARLTMDTLRIVSVTRNSFRMAARLADQPALNLRAGDALHLAICADEGAAMCTLDHRLAEAAPAIGVECVSAERIQAPA